MCTYSCSLNCAPYQGMKNSKAKHTIEPRDLDLYPAYKYFSRKSFKTCP